MVSSSIIALAATALFGSTALAYSGDGTYYDPDSGYGSCGSLIQNSESAVALPVSYGKAHCGQSITISYGGKTISGVKVLDTCEGCGGDSIDMTPVVFEQLAELSVGRLHNVEWSFD